MPAPKTKADYPQLQHIAEQFRAEGRIHAETISRLGKRMAVLRDGGWVGVAANAFYAEMDGIVMPSLNRLASALDQAASHTQAISQAFQAAERDAAAVLRMDDTVARTAPAES